MAKFLVTYEAVVGREKPRMDPEGYMQGVPHQQLPPVTITFYAMVEASNVEQANDMVVQYADPGFKARVLSVEEIAKGWSLDQMAKRLAPAVILQEQL